ncbi:hypothetical protein NP493_134g01013 [Ridgeia piscesae]|uniref:Peptidase M12B domain-containing protein n=1 Tax=Ridgeia piscesae TaxID=27915 RepID=A0AAD9P576_RIDPI|nr:hypothetical protein NP493_134g01013 [Ridgeia piscesae]
MRCPVALLLMLSLVVRPGLGVPTEDEDEGELVLVKELGGGRMRRSAESSLPRYLHMQFCVGDETMSLQLERNTDIDTNIPFTFAGNKSRKVYIPDRQDIALYQDGRSGAAVSVTAKKHTNDGQYNVLIDLTYRMIDPTVSGIKIRPFLTEFHIAQSPTELNWTSESIIRHGDTVRKTLTSEAVIEKLAAWRLEDGRTWKNPDHAMLWTRYDIAESVNNSQTLGLSYEDGICVGQYGVSIIEDGGLTYWSVAAHELGHK